MFFEQPSIETTLSIEYSGGCARPYGRTCRRFVNAHFIAAKRQNDVSGLRAKPTHMSRVFMGFAACGETLFEARCGAKDFFDSLKLLQAGAFLIAARIHACPIFGATPRNWTKTICKCKSGQSSTAAVIRRSFVEPACKYTIYFVCPDIPAALFLLYMSGKSCYNKSNWFPAAATAAGLGVWTWAQ